MLSYTGITPKKIIILGDEPHEVLSASGVVKKQRQKPHNTAKLRNIVSGATIERTFTQADKIEEANIETREVKYLYTNNKDESWFCDPTNPKNRFSFRREKIAKQLPYMRENDDVDSLLFNDKIFSIRLPIKVDLKVVEAPPNVKGNTAQGGVKPVVLETGLTVTVPMFIKEDDVIRVNTDTGEYVERV